MAIYPLLPSPADSSDLPESRRAALCFLFGLASDGVYICPVCYQPGGSLLRCLSTLTGSKAPAVYFCCTVPGVASARRYLAPCPVKPGLSSPAALRYRGSGHLSYSQRVLVYHRIMGLSRETMLLLPTLFPANHVAFPCIPTADSLCIS